MATEEHGFDEDRKAITARLEELYQSADCYFRTQFRTAPFTLDLRGKCAGQAWTVANRLRFNRQLLRENREHFLLHTVAHEVAHLIAFQRFGQTIRPHGREWQSIMTKVFGLPANRTHNYRVTQSEREQFHYRCQCEGKTIQLGKIRHKRAMAGTVYLCNKCRTPVVFKPQPSND